MRCAIANACQQAQGRQCCLKCDEAACVDRCKNDPGRCGCAIEPVQRGMPRKYDWAEMAKLKGEGLSISSIAVRLGCGEETVRQALKKMGHATEEGPR